MSEEQVYAYIEPMGHGAHFVAEVIDTNKSVIQGMSQFNVLRGDGTVDHTVLLGAGAIFRATVISRNAALIAAKKLEGQRSIWVMTPPQQALLPDRTRAADESSQLNDARTEDNDPDEDEDDEYDEPDFHDQPVGFQPHD